MLPVSVSLPVDCVCDYVWVFFSDALEIISESARHANDSMKKTVSHVLRYGEDRVIVLTHNSLERNSLDKPGRGGGALPYEKVGNSNKLVTETGFFYRSHSTGHSHRSLELCTQTKYVFTEDIH